VIDYTAQRSEGSDTPGQRGYREEEGRPSMAHDSLGALAETLQGEQLPLFAGAVKAGVSYAGQLITNTALPV